MSRPRWIGTALAGLLLAQVLVAEAGASELRVRLPASTQRALLAADAVTVDVSSRKPLTVRLTAKLRRVRGNVRHRPARGLTVPRRVRLESRRARTVRLRLTRAGRSALRACGRYRLTVRARAVGDRTGRGASSRRLTCRTVTPVERPAPADPPASPAPPHPSTPPIPSGVPVPVGDLPGWRQVFTDDFQGVALDNRKWGRYSGVPRGDPGGYWDPSHVVVGGGVAKLRTYRDPAFGGRWVSGGMSSARALSQKFGKYEVRFRVDAGYGVAAILLLFPTADRWPPEIDFAEHGGASETRAQMTATLHHGPEDRLVQDNVAGDFTTWHTMGVEWTSGRLVYTLDGRPWASVSGAHVPSEPMELDAQTQAGTEGDVWNPSPNATTPSEVDMDIDWVVAYAPASARATRLVRCR